MKRLLFFVNPNAGHTEIRSSLMQVIQIFTAGGYDVTVHPPSPRISRASSPRAARTMISSSAPAATAR